ISDMYACQMLSASMARPHRQPEGATMAAARDRGAGRRYSGMDAAERTRARRAAILGAALELFGTAGFAATSVKQICVAAGLTERYFYESFRDRHAALAGVYGEIVAELRLSTQAAI